MEESTEGHGKKKGKGEVMDRYLKRFISCFIIINLGHCFAMSASNNLLQTVFHHRVQTTLKDKQDFFELGKLILSFSGEPVIDLKNNPQSEESGIVERTFFFPATVVQDPECIQMVKNIQSQQSPHYSIIFNAISKPAPTLQLIVRYDHEKVGLTYTVLEASGSQRRLIFTFYNKTMVKKVDDSHATILRTAQSFMRQGVILDCGHGGNDLGAVGCNGLQEKDVNLEIGTQLATLLRKNGFEVFLTRTADVFVALDERTLIDDKNADASILVSIHANAAPYSAASGIETFFFNAQNLLKSNDKHAVTTVSVMQDRCALSQLLAHCIHDSVLNHIGEQYAVTDRRVKTSFLQVLAGSAIPAALVELGFLTNASEANRMKNKDYQRELASAIYDGIVGYFEKIKTS